MTEQDELQPWLEMARRSELPSATQLARGRSALLSEIAAAASPQNVDGDAATTPSTTSTATSATSSGVGTVTSTVTATLSLGTKLVIATLGVALALVATLSLSATQSDGDVKPRPARETSNKALVTTPAPPPSTIVAPARDEQPSVTPTPAAVRKRAVVAHKAQASGGHAVNTTGTTTNDFAAEVALLRVAIEAQRQGDLERARNVLNEHIERYPQSQLDQERRRLQARLTQSAP